MTLIEYRSGLISLLSLDARRAFTGPYSDDCRRHFSSAPRSHLLNTVVVRTRPQTERATDSAMCTNGLPYESHRRGEQIVAVDALAAGDVGHSRAFQADRC